MRSMAPWLNQEIDILEEAEILKSIYLAEQATYLVVELPDPARKQIQLDDSMRILCVLYDDNLPHLRTSFELVSRGFRPGLSIKNQWKKRFLWSTICR